MEIDMDRRKFLTGAAVAPVAVAAPAIAAPPVPAAAVDGLCPIAWRTLAHSMVRFDEYYFEEWKKEGHYEKLYISGLATSEIMARKYPRWFINERLMLGPASLAHGRSRFSDKPGKICIVARSDEVHRFDATSFDSPVWPHAMLESIADSFSYGIETGEYSPRLVGDIRNETEVAADKLNKLWKKGEELGYVPYPYIPLRAAVEIVDGRQYVIWKSRYGIVEV